MSRFQKELDDGAQTLLPASVLTLKAGSKQCHFVPDRVEQCQTVTGAFKDPVNALHQFLVEAVDGVRVVQRQQAEKVADFATRLCRSLSDVEVEQFLEQSLLEHETSEQRFGGHCSQQGQAVIQGGACATVATSCSGGKRHKLTAVNSSGSLSRTSAPDGFLPLTGIVGHDISTTGRYPLGDFAQFFKS